MLTVDRHTVTEAANGKEALQLFNGVKYDLVITDYLMPGMRGDELAKQIKRLVPTQLVFIVTAYVEKLFGSDHAADAVLGKPISLEELRRLVGLTDLKMTMADAGPQDTTVQVPHSELGYGTGVPAHTAPRGISGGNSARRVRRWGIND